MAEKKAVENQVSIEECYPFNLLADAIADSENAVVWDFYVPDVLRIVANLDGQERRVLELRYRDGLTLEAAGGIIKKTRERVRQVQRNGLRSLRGRLLSGDGRVMRRSEYLKLLTDYNELCVRCEQLAAKVPESSALSPSRVTSCCENVLNLGLSVRTENCLRRTKLETVADVIQFDKDPNKTWDSIWGLGVGSKNELRTKIYDCTGYTLHV